jgi:inorganic pyrophosphatase
MENNSSKSFELAKPFLGKEVEVVMDRPMGSIHPKYGFYYEANYGYIEGIKAPDGEDLDAYYLGTDKPLDKASGIVKAIIHRLDDDDDKLVVMPKEINLADEEIEKLTLFQEKFFKHKIIRGG